MCQNFVGFVNWFRNFIPNLSLILAPITDKFNNEKDYRWNVDDDEVRKKIIEAIENSVSLAHARYDEEFVLQTDASEIYLGAILFQCNKAVAIYSKKISPQERNYTITEKELFAIISSL